MSKRARTYRTQQTATKNLGSKFKDKKTLYNYNNSYNEEFLRLAGRCGGYKVVVLNNRDSQEFIDSYENLKGHNLRNKLVMRLQEFLKTYDGQCGLQRRAMQSKGIPQGPLDIEKNGV